ncbi:NlpC/P60 family protein [Corynebacterium ureicelerivorans]|uniref:DIP1281 family NlpC/P60 protein n=1 Tax=Corynebacterium ureicelerivorans TaxID=401472 RepID=UPI002654067D|nr:NlpC/P60 family protein [Corynebacterium ureicelerivorans]MDN8605746.1 NlpC/P60 family protein [Corynebacterium ureicelerivorans]
MAYPQRGTRLSRARKAFGSAVCAAAISATVVVVSPAASSQSSTSAVGELVTAVSRAQADVDALNLDLGGLQEAVNQALVDLHDAQVKAEQARRGRDEAERRLHDAQERVDALRAELGELSRSQYRGANPGDALVAVSGSSSQRDVLERSQLLRQRSEETRAKLAEAERARAEAANDEATLREVSEFADAAESEAEQAQAHAQGLLNENRAAFEAAAAERDAAQTDLDRAQAALDEQRPTQPEAADGQQQAAQAGQASSATAADPYAATLTVSRGDTTYEVPEEVVDLVRQRVSSSAPDVPQPSREAVADAVRTVAQTSSTGDLSGLISQSGVLDLDEDEIAKAGAIAAGIALVGGATANYRSPGSANAEADAEADAGALVTAFGDGLTGALHEEEGNSETVAEVLPDVESAEEVTEQAQTSVAAVSDAVSDASQIEAVIARAQSMIGTPYVWGGGDANGPTTGVDGGTVTGFDCSGLVLYAFAAAGVALPHYTGYQYQRGTQVPASEAQRGDLLFWGPGGNQHVAIYLGDGTMIEAPRSGQNVRISPVRWSGMAPNAVRLL